MKTSAISVSDLAPRRPMAKVSYPFAALPNQICRGGHGPVHIAVLAVLLSHGRTSASAQTLAREIGCDRKSVFKSLKYWREEGPKHGIYLRTGERMGCTTVIEVEVVTCETRTENGTDNPVDNENHQSQKRNGVVPQTERVPVPKTAHKEEPARRPLKNHPLPPQEDVVEAFASNRRRSRGDPHRKKPYLEGDLAHFDESRGVWRVRIHTGEWVDYGGNAKQNLVWK